MFLVCYGRGTCAVRCIFELYRIELRSIIVKKLVKQQTELLHTTRNAIVGFTESSYSANASSCLLLSKISINTVVNKVRLLSLDIQSTDHFSELRNITEWSEHDTVEAVQKYPKLLRNSLSSASEVYRVLQLNGISKEKIRRNPWLLAYSVYTIKRKLSLIRRLEVNDETILLLRFSYRELSNVIDSLFAKVTDKDQLYHRLLYLCQHLNLEINELIDLTKEHTPILTIEFSKIQNIMKLLEDAGVDAESICKDLWIFRHNEDVMIERIRQVELKGAPLKTWMLRCTEYVFQNSLDRWSEKVRVLGKDHTTIDYLSKRLNCSKEYIQCLNEKEPRLLTVQPRKIKEVLDFLFQKGFSPEQICNATRILRYSLATLQRRLKDFADLDYHPTSLHVLCNTNKLHKRFLKKLKLAKKYSVKLIKNRV